LISASRLHLSGGTTELLLSDGGALAALGTSLDLHAGQLIDRVGVRMGLPFPAGPELEKLALGWPEPAEALLPVSLPRGDLDCHLSGAETRAGNGIERQTFPMPISAETFDQLARTVAPCTWRRAGDGRRQRRS
jgi:N6-L-threonylcarbamoyladenine synthase